MLCHTQAWHLSFHHHLPEENHTLHHPKLEPNVHRIHIMTISDPNPATLWKEKTTIPTKNYNTQKIKPCRPLGWTHVVPAHCTHGYELLSGMNPNPCAHATMQSYAQAYVNMPDAWHATMPPWSALRKKMYFVYPTLSYCPCHVATLALSPPPAFRLPHCAHLLHLQSPLVHICFPLSFVIRLFRGIFLTCDFFLSKVNWTCVHLL
jgi:hypothetical protein